MITRTGLIAGTIGLAIYLALYLAYAVASGWSVPWPVALGLGVIVFLGSAKASDIAVALLEEAAENAQDI